MVYPALLRIITWAVSASLVGCSHAPAKCDYAQFVAACTASVDPAGTTLWIRAARCSQVEIRTEDRTRVIRADDGEYQVGSSGSNVEVVGCRTYKDIRPP